MSNHFLKEQVNRCNFTSIGGVLEALGYAQYNDKKYIKLEK